MADTGCQSCLASMSIICRLGLNENSLIPVTTRMHAANSKGINIMGAVVLRFYGQSQPGLTLESRQIVYVTNDSDKLFLTREACEDLGIISGTFPTIGEALKVQGCPNVDTASNTESPPSCNCPHREHPPPKPTKLLFPVTEANRQRLQDWLLNYYKSSTFNTCEHQPFPFDGESPNETYGRS